MVAGHLAIGLAVDRRRSHLPLAVTLLAAVWPDLVMAAIGFAASGAAADAYSHSLPAFGAWALLLGIATAIAYRDRHAGIWVAALVATHLPADWITSRLALWPGGPQWGMGLYARPGLDLAIEAALAVAAWAIYRRGLPAPVRRSVLAWMPLVVLLALQGIWAGLTWR